MLIKKSFLRKLSTLLIAALAFSPVCAQNPDGAMKFDPSMMRNAKTSPEAQALLVPAPELKDSDVVLNIDGKDYTVGEVKAISRLMPLTEVNVRPEQVATANAKLLEALGKRIAGYNLLKEEALAAKLALSKEDEEKITNEARGFADQALYKEVILDKVKEPTDDEVKARYEAEKESKYKQTEELQMRHLFVSTYVEYEVKEGDTLESIAEKVSGDKAAANRILSVETKRPRVEVLQEAKEGETVPGPLPPKALVVGEKLMVPGGAEKKKEAKAKIEAGLARIKGGEAFQKVASEISENENKGTVMKLHPADNPRPIMPELQKAFMDLKDGEYSTPLETKHGFQVVYREKYVPAGYKDVKDVEGAIKAQLKSEAQKAGVDAFFAEVSADPDLAVYNKENLAKTGADAKDDDVVVTIKDATFTRKQILDSAPAEFTAEAPLTQESLQKNIAKLRPTQLPLLGAFMEKKGLLNTPENKAHQETTRTVLLARMFVEQQVEKMAGTIPDDQVKKYFDENPAKFTVVEAYSLLGIAVHADASLPEAEREKAAVAKLTEAVKGVQAVDDFRTKAGELNTPGDRRFSAGGNMGRMTAEILSPKQLEVIRGVAAPGLSPVIFEDGEAKVFWVLAAQPAKTYTLDEKKADITATLLKDKKRDLLTDLFKQYDEKAAPKVKVLRTDADVAKPVEEKK